MVIDLFEMKHFLLLVLCEVVWTSQKLGRSHIIRIIMKLERTVGWHSSVPFFERYFRVALDTIWLSFVFLPEEFCLENKYLA